MGFSNSFFSKPAREEIDALKHLAINFPEELDSRELWILENFAEGDEDDE